MICSSQQGKYKKYELKQKEKKRIGDDKKMEKRIVMISMISINNSPTIGSVTINTIHTISNIISTVTI